MAITKTALITGASSGIGLELARVFARRGFNLVLVARSLEKLTQLAEELRAKHSIEAHAIGKDLSHQEEVNSLYEETQAQGIQIDYLINNAGFGLWGMFVETDWEKEAQMIALNMTSLVYLTKLYLPGMKERGFGRIMNLASTAAFQPGPTMAVYYATKSFVLFFGEALRNELEGTGITVTTLCPGPTVSGFQEAAAMGESDLVKGKKLPTAQEVAEFGFHAMEKGKGIVIHGKVNRFNASLVKFLPRNLVLKMVRKAQGTPQS